MASYNELVFSAYDCLYPRPVEAHGPTPGHTRLRHPDGKIESIPEGSYILRHGEGDFRVLDGSTFEAQYALAQVPEDALL